MKSAAESLWARTQEEGRQRVVEEHGVAEETPGADLAEGSSRVEGPTLRENAGSGDSGPFWKLVALPTNRDSVESALDWDIDLFELGV